MFAHLAGWTKSADGIRTKDGKQLALDLHYVPAASAYNKPTAELTAKQWEAIGVRVKLTTDTIGAMSQAMFQTAPGRRPGLHSGYRYTPRIKERTQG